MIENDGKPETERKAAEATRRPLGQNTVWPKVKGIHPGAVVWLQGLSMPELNGRKGRCLTFNQDSGRWTVDLGDGQKALRIENLIPAAGEKPPTKQSAEAAKSLRVASKAEKSAKELHAESYGWDG